MPIAVYRLAEREGFEPSEEYDPLTRLAGEHLQPLGHLSTDNDTRQNGQSAIRIAQGGVATRGPYNQNSVTESFFSRCLDAPAGPQTA